MANLQYFKCKGSIGLYYGLGTDEVAVSFENLQGLITLAGNNGHGKTSFLEMLSPFPVFPSRQQKNPQKYNFKKQFRLRDSYKETCYLHQGKKYIFRVEIPAGTTMSPEGYIWCDGVPMVKGKISEYKLVVSELFGSERMFYSSIFSCQGGAKLTDLTVGDFKNLLIELLGLKKYNEYWHNAGAVIKECDASLAEVLRDLEIYSIKELEMEENQKALATWKTYLEEKQMEVLGLKGALAGTRQKIEALQKEFSDAEKQEVIILEKNKQLQALTDEIVKLRASAAEITRKHNEYVEEYEARTKPWRELVVQKIQILGAATEMETAKATIEKLSAELSGLAEQGSEKKNQIAEIDAHLSRLASDRVTALNDPELKRLTDEKTRLLNDLALLNQRIKQSLTRIETLEKDPETKALEKRLEQFIEAESLLTLRPAECTIDACPFIKDALDKISGKAGIQAEIEISRAKTAAVISEEKNALHQMGEKETQDIFKNMDEIGKQLAAKNESIRESVNTIQAKAKIITAAKEALLRQKDALADTYRETAGKLDAEKTRAENLKTLAGKKADLETAERLLEQAGFTYRQELDDYGAEMFGTDQKIETTEQMAEAIKNEILAITPARTKLDIQIALDSTNQHLTAVTARLEEKAKEVSNIEKTIAVLEDKIRLSEKDAEEIARLRSREAFIREELSKWSYIRDAVSKSGLQALEISAAAPLLTSIANDLLHSAYGGEFFLDLVTQDPETGAEILDIMITRGDGQTYSLCDFSGGESVWVLQAFKAAQILVNAEKSGVHFATCFADEESGALDKEKAERFIQMYRALMVQGNFEKLFFISHIPECQAMADHSLVFQKGGIVSESDIGMVA